MSERVIAPAVSAITRTSTGSSPTQLAETLQEALAESYRIEHELGGGGMGRVFVAEDLRLKRRVVLKVLPPETVPTDGTGRFRQEIELAAQLQHPHIVPLLTADATDGTLYYTMPFVTGESLRDRLAREGQLPLTDAVNVWHDVLDALAHAHTRGVVHSDIKPGNILLSGRHALVTDFGIARAIESATGDAQAHPRGPVIGTPAYMAPEQVQGEHEVDPRVDIYQAGLVMYEMLSGTLPFSARSTRELLRSRVDGEPLPLRCPEAPSALVELVMRCLAREPLARPPSADAVLGELEQVAAPSVLTAPLEPAPWDRPTRRRVAYTGAALAAFALAIVAVTRQEPAPSSPRYVPDIAAYEWYVRGMDLALMRSDSGRRQGIAYFEQAIAIDSLYAAAYAGLARLYVQLWNAAPIAERAAWAARADAAAVRAVSLDDSDAEALVALGWVRLVTRDFAAAEAALKRAVALNPTVPRGREGLARLYMITDRPVEQLAEAVLGMALDPFSHSAIREFALALATNGRCEEALDRLRPLKSLTPPARVAGVVGGMCYASREMWPEALGELRWAAAQRDEGATFAPALVGYALARAGQADEAAAILSDLLAGRTESHGAFGIATLYAGMRDYDEVFAWLARAVDDQSINPYVMHPIFADLHRDPRFDVVRARMGVPQAAR